MSQSPRSSGSGTALSANEMRARAAQFARDWADEPGDELEQDQTFVRELLAVFGVTETRAAAYQRRALRSSTGRQGRIDALIPGTAIIEMKSQGKDIVAAERQALDYLDDLPDAEQPRYVLTSDFHKFRLLDLLAPAGEASTLEFDLADFPKHVLQVAPIARAGIAAVSLAEQEAASVQAAKLMASLYDSLSGSGYDDDEASIFLVRTLFCLFADDSQMQGWEPALFHRYILARTGPDGSNLGPMLTRLFERLDVGPERRLRGQLPDDLLAKFPYVDGDTFAKRLAIPEFTAKTRAILIKCCEFDWSRLSPAIFGSLFQTVKSRRARRELGEHYTTEQNIMKVIGPLFLDELNDQFVAILDDAAKLRALRRHLGQLRFLDPACGCGNFLVVAYRELRALELKILVRLQELQASGAGGRQSRTTFGLALTFDESDLAVRREHFYGIEIEDWPAQIARTALHLADHQANLAMIDALGQGPTTLPLDKVNTITTGNALRLEWKNIVPATQHLYIIGNPPFVGQKEKSARQTEDMKLVWGPRWDGYLDYVTAWYKTAIDLFALVNYDGEFAFVSTNSISQGQPVATLFSYIFDHGWRIKFAHSTFAWTSEAPDAAGVHCVILGFDRTRQRPVRVFDYQGSPKGIPTESLVERPLNAYLLDAPNVFIKKRSTVLAADLPAVGSGSSAVDWDNLIVTGEQYPHVAADKCAAKYLRKYVGGDELINDIDRWCLWLEQINPRDIAKSPILKERVAEVQRLRLASRRLATREAALTPHLFAERRQPRTDYLAIPNTFSEHRLFATGARLSPDVIANRKVFTVEDRDGFALAIVSSSMFITWQKAVGGRLESRPSFSNTIVWNNFPLPALTDKQRNAIIAGGQTVLAARAELEQRAASTGELKPSLADLYHPLAMDPILLKAHAKLDKAVDAAFGLNLHGRINARAAADRLTALFESYEELTASER